MNKEVLLIPGMNKLAGGVTARVKLERPHENVIAGDTALHEGGHAILLLVRGRHLRRASRIPGDGYLGITEGEVDAVSAMGPDALGHSGTGFDRRVARYFVSDIGTAAAVAKDTIYENWAAFHALSRAIEAEGEVSGHRAKQVIEEDKNPKALVEMNGPMGLKSFVMATREVDGFIVPLILSEPVEERNN